MKDIVRRKADRGALPRTPLGLAPQTPVLQLVC
jgi:hypothetical protein